MKLCKIDQRGRITENSLVDLMGERGLTKEERTWARYITVDFDGTVYIWEKEPRLYNVADHEQEPLNHNMLLNRWVQPANQDSYCDCIFKGRFESFESGVYQLHYEENNNNENTILIANDVGGLAA